MLVKGATNVQVTQELEAIIKSIKVPWNLDDFQVAVQ